MGRKVPKEKWGVRSSLVSLLKNNALSLGCLYEDVFADNCPYVFKCMCVQNKHIGMLGLGSTKQENRMVKVWIKGRSGEGMLPIFLLVRVILNREYENLKQSHGQYD